MRKTVTGWFFTVTGILACPCHLVITLPLAVAVLSGTALGGWMATHKGTIAAGATIYFVGALVVGFTLLSARRSHQTGATCAAPAADAASLKTGWPVGTSRHASTRTSAHAGDGDDLLDGCGPAQLPLSERRSLTSTHALPAERPSSNRADSARPAEPTEQTAETGALTRETV